MPVPGTAPIAIVVTVLAVPLLVAIVIADPGKVDRESVGLRRMTVALTFVLVVGAALATARLVDELLKGAPNLDNARTLLWAGLLVWVDVIVTFALLYWEIDGGGPSHRLHHPPEHPALAFPQHMNESLAPPGWAPTFPDYLYLGLTNAVAFSPTDVMPLQRWAKLAMGIQSLVSLVILSLIVANAVNLMGS